ncbi:MAG: hypothetical protein ACE5HF_11220 [Gemmatimonadota bacterium]
MRTLYERTIFKVDVLTLRVRLGRAETSRLEDLVRRRAGAPALEDSIADLATHATDAWAEIEFLRDVGLDRFVDGVRKDVRRAREAGIITEEDERMVSEGLPRWYAFLADRRIRKGDRMTYRIRADTLRTRYVGRDGDLLLDQTDVGPERRLAVLGAWFAPRSSFRRGLLRSLTRPAAGRP